MNKLAYMHDEAMHASTHSSGLHLEIILLIKGKTFVVRINLIRLQRSSVGGDKSSLEFNASSPAIVPSCMVGDVGIERGDIQGYQ